MSTAVHHLTKYHLRSSPPFSDVYEVVKSTLEGRTVIVYNVIFDRRLMHQTAQAFNLDTAWLECLDWQCAMRAYTEFLGIKNAPKLEGGDHTALGDCRATLDLLYRMAGSETSAGSVESQQPKVEPILAPLPRNLVGATGHELLAYLAPPIEAIEHFERYMARGQLPQSIVEWLERWQGIRGNGATPIDGATQTAWAEVGERVRV